MGDLIQIVIVVALIIGALIAMSYAGRGPKAISEEEFERRAKEAPGLLTTGLMGLQQILDPAAKKAVEVQQDLKEGLLEEEQQSGDTNDTTPRSEDVNEKTSEDSDA